MTQSTPQQFDKFISFHLKNMFQNYSINVSAVI